MSSAQLDVDRSRFGSAEVVTVRGEVDMSSGLTLILRLNSVIRGGEGDVVVDLCAVTFMDSSGIRLLVNAFKRLKRENRRFAIVCPSGPVLRVFDVTGLVRVFDIYPTVEAAIKAGLAPAR